MELQETTCGAAFPGIDRIRVLNAPTISAHSRSTGATGRSSPRSLAFSISCASAWALISLALLARAASSG